MTDWLLEFLTVAEVPVGDHLAPISGGWSSGQPNTGVFAPYIVLVSGSARTVQGRLRPEMWDWKMSYTVRCHGVTRNIADQLATRVINSLSGLPRDEIGMYRMDLVSIDSIDGVAVDKSTTPPFFSVGVNLTVDVVRTRIC
jgi:hypothetical protein